MINRSFIFFTGLMLFSLFFGAGNLIFPPELGQDSSTYLNWSLIGFLLTAVGLPLLTIVSIAKTGGNGVQDLAGRVSPLFGLIFSITIYLSIGPFTGIPRIANVAYEMGFGSTLPESKLLLLAYHILFFGIAYFLSLHPQKLVQKIGKWLTPLLIGGLCILFIRYFLRGKFLWSTPSLHFQEHPFFAGFLKGYLTMDTISALAFGIIIVHTIQQKTKSHATKYAIQAGAIAAIGLTFVYVLLSIIGATSTQITNATSGGEILVQVTSALLGPFGILLLGFIITLACLTTTIGLITACSQYFIQVVPKITYVQMVRMITFVSILFANLGLEKIIAFSSPILTIIYPISITLVGLNLCERSFRKSQLVYICGCTGAGIVGLLKGLEEYDIFHISLPWLPLYDQGMGWLIPAIVASVIGYTCSFFCRKQVPSS